MKRISLRIRILVLFACIVLLGLAGLWVGIVMASGPLIVGAIFTAVIVCAWLVIDQTIAKPLQHLSAALADHARTSDHETRTERYASLGELGQAAQTVIQSLRTARKTLAETEATETSALLAERTSLSNLMADLPFGVVLCSGLHHIALYNRCADVLLDSAHAPGLDHSIFDYVEAAPIQAAYDRLLGDHELHQTHLFLTAHEDSRPLIAQMRLVHLPQEHDVRPAYILTLRAPRNLEQTEQDDTLSLRTADLLMSGDLVTATSDQAPLPQLEPEDITAEDLVHQIASRFPATEISVSVLDVDKLETVPALLVPLSSMVLDRLLREIRSTTLSVLVAPIDDDTAALTIGWGGQPLAPRDLDRCLAETCMGDPNLTGHQILEILGTDAWSDQAPFDRHLIKIPLLRAPSNRALPVSEKMLTYDLGLLVKTPAPDLSSTEIGALSYVVFDTETTGPSPDSGDEICQIAALRIVNGEAVPNERVDQLVDPARKIPLAASKIHKITNDMVQGVPKIGVAGQNLHSFARGAVLVSHDAKSDLAFLNHHQNDIGHVFDNPVIDIASLSAVIFDQEQDHSLPALCERLGVPVPSASNHTAMAKTEATAAAFLAMVEMCKARGIVTFDDLRNAITKNKKQPKSSD